MIADQACVETEEPEAVLLELPQRRRVPREGDQHDPRRHGGRAEAALRAHPRATGTCAAASAPTSSPSTARAAGSRRRASICRRPLSGSRCAPPSDADIRVETARLRLRAFRETDLDAFAAMSADAEVMRFIGNGETVDRNGSWRTIAGFLGHWRLRGCGMWAIERKDRRRLPRPRRAAPSAVLARARGRLGARRAHAWGQGYAREGAAAALDFARRTLPPQRLVSFIRPGNERSVQGGAGAGRTARGRRRSARPAGAGLCPPRLEPAVLRPAYQKYAVDVRPSAIDGHGVFAAEGMSPRREDRRDPRRIDQREAARIRAHAPRARDDRRAVKRRAVDFSSQRPDALHQPRLRDANARLSIDNGRVEFFALRVIASVARN